jgi:hypothetical protein
VKNYRKNLMLAFVAAWSLSGNSFGGEKWIKYQDTNTSESYIDSASIEANADVVRYRSVLNFRQRVNQTFSIIFLKEIRCRTGEGRFMTADGYSDHFGGGRFIGATTPEYFGKGNSKYEPLDPSNATEVLEYKILCNGRK